MVIFKIMPALWINVKIINSLSTQGRLARHDVQSTLHLPIHLSFFLNRLKTLYNFKMMFIGFFTLVDID